jgi:hypothetical protein
MGMAEADDSNSTMPKLNINSKLPLASGYEIPILGFGVSKSIEL